MCVCYRAPSRAHQVEGPSWSPCSSPPPVCPPSFFPLVPSGLLNPASSGRSRRALCLRCKHTLTHSRTHTHTKEYNILSSAQVQTHILLFYPLLLPRLFPRPVRVPVSFLLKRVSKWRMGVDPLNTHARQHRSVACSYLHRGGKKEFLLWKWLRACEPLTSSQLTRRWGWVGGASPPMPEAPEARSSTYLGISPLVCQRRASLRAGLLVWREGDRVGSKAWRESRRRNRRRRSYIYIFIFYFFGLLCKTNWSFSFLVTKSSFPP